MLVKPLVRSIVRSIAGRPTNSLGSGFAPTSLFSAGEQGYVYDLNDLSTLYLDSAGTTAASVNGLVGLVLDKSKGLALGAEIVPNGTFDNATGWTVPAGWTVSGGVVTASATSSSLIQTGAPGVAGTWYKVEFDWTHVSGTLSVRVGAGAATTFTTSGRKVCYLLSSGAGGVEFYGGTVSGTLDNLTAVPLQGNHAYQSTTGNKPVLRGSPAGANLVTNGDFASGTGWTTGAGWSIGSGVATKVAGTTNSLLQAVSLTAGKVYRLTYTITATAGGVQPLFSGGTSAFGALRSASGTYVEWLTANTGNVDFGFTVNALFAGTVDNVEVVDVSAGSVQAPYALRFDGVDDFLQTASVNFTATDKMTVCHGVRKLSDATQGIVTELTASLVANTGAFYLSAPDSAAANFAFASKGTVSATDVETGFASPNLSVITGIGNISGDSSQLRRNGTPGTAIVTDQGTGNYANAVLYFGRRGGASLPYNGLFYSAICVGKAVSATELANIERWTNQRTGAY